MLTNAQRDKLKGVLLGLSTPEEQKEMTAFETAELKMQLSAIKDNIDTVVSRVESKEVMDTLMNMAKSIKNTRAEYVKWSEEMAIAFREGNEAIIKTLRDQMTAADFNKNAGPLYKTMIEAIAGVERAVHDKPVPHWQWPQYASVSVRDKNFANINPSIAPFNITASYDYVALAYTGSDLTTVTYKTGGASGTTVAILVLAYSGSNLVSVTRTV